MSYPPPAGYGYPPQQPGYPPMPPQPQQPAPYGYPSQPQPQQVLGFGGINNAPPAGGMPGAPGGYGGGGPGGYPQQPPQQNYPQAPQGYPVQQPPQGYPTQQPPQGFPGQPGYNSGSSFGGMAYAASAATNFRQPNQYYPTQQQPQQPPHLPLPPQQQQHIYNQTSSQQPPTQLTTPASSSVSRSREPATQGSVKDYSPFNAQEDAEILRKAMKGFGTDEKAVTHIIGTRANAQRQKIKLEFATMYGKELVKELKGELSGHFEEAVLALLMPPAEYDAYQIHIAMKGLGTDEKALIEILCSRTNKQIKEAADVYKKLYKNDLEKMLKSETSGHFKRLLVSLVQGSRLESEAVNPQKAKEDANALYMAGEAKWGTDESRFNAVLALRSDAQLRLIFEEYHRFSKKTMEQAIKSEMSGDLKDGMMAIVKCARDKPAFFAEKLYYSMKGMGTDDKTLIRIIVSRSEIDMVQIKHSFQNMYGKTLASFINDDCSGDYKRLLVTVCGGQ